LVSTLFHFSTAEGDMVDTSKSTRYEVWLGISFMLASYLLKSCFIKLHLNLCFPALLGASKCLVWGSLLAVTKCLDWPSTLHYKWV
jgi:hypothetical protein